MYKDSLAKPPWGGSALAGMEGGDWDPPGWFREESDPESLLRRFPPVGPGMGSLGMRLGCSMEGFRVLDRD